MIEYDSELRRFKLPAEIEKNTAVVDALLDAFGGNTFAQLDSSLLTVEDTMSTLTGVGTLAAA
jgi:hypothetical protein